jgi:hypothetical protein
MKNCLKITDRGISKIRIGMLFDTILPCIVFAIFVSLILCCQCDVLAVATLISILPLLLLLKCVCAHTHRFQSRQHIAAMRVAFVEIQAPIIDTSFFAWLLDNVSATTSSTSCTTVILC